MPSQTSNPSKSRGQTTKRYKHHDWIAPGKPDKTLDDGILIREESDVVFGCFWYLDFHRQEHEFRFILSIDESTTHPNIADEVDPRYSPWN